MKLSSLLIVLLVAISCYCKDSCQPSQIHIALSDDFTSNPSIASPIKAIFHTQSLCDSAYITIDTPQNSLIVHATEVNFFQAEYSKTNYTTYVHIFDFPNLDYDQIYHYTCYGSNTSSQDPEGPFPFYVPNPQPTTQMVSMVFFGDLGSTKDGKATVDRLSAIKNSNFSNIAAYVHMGDLAYALESNGGTKGDDFMNAIQDFAASIPYMITPGNHEIKANFSNVNMRFKMPYFDETQNHYYSYNLGNIHFATIDLDFVILYPDLLPYMVSWLDKDLAQANTERDERPWIIVYTHRPLYCSKKLEDCENNAKTYSDIEDVLNKYHVDLYLSGHVHAYERMLPIYKGNVAQFQKADGDSGYHYIINPQAPVYLVQGIAGHSGDHDDKRKYKGKKFTVTVDTEYSVLGLHSLNQTHLYLENIYSKTGQVSDYMYLIKDSSLDLGGRPGLWERFLVLVQKMFKMLEY